MRVHESKSGETLGYLSIPDVAQRYGTSERHIRHLVHRRSIPYIKVGHLVRFDPRDLDDWVASHRVPSGGAA